MKKPILLASLSLASLSLASAAEVEWRFADFTANPLTVRRVMITPIAPVGVSEGRIITGDRQTYTNNGTGSLIVSNLVVGRSYRVEFIGPFANTVFTNAFDANVTGFVNAANFLAAPIQDGAVVAYSQVQANARFHRRSGDTSTNASFYGEFRLPAGAASGYVWTATNAATGAGAWLPPVGDDGISAATATDISQAAALVVSNGLSARILATNAALLSNISSTSNSLYAAIGEGGGGGLDGAALSAALRSGTNTFHGRITTAGDDPLVVSNRTGYVMFQTTNGSNQYIGGDSIVIRGKWLNLPGGGSVSGDSGIIWGNPDNPGNGGGAAQIIGGTNIAGVHNLLAGSGTVAIEDQWFGGFADPHTSLRLANDEARGSWVFVSSLNFERNTGIKYGLTNEVSTPSAPFSFNTQYRSNNVLYANAYPSISGARAMLPVTPYGGGRNMGVGELWFWSRPEWKNSDNYYVPYSGAVVGRTLHGTSTNMDYTTTTNAGWDLRGRQVREVSELNASQTNISSVLIDMRSGETLRLRPASTTLVFTLINQMQGPNSERKTLWIHAGVQSRTLSFPPEITWLDSTAPTALSSGEVLRVEIETTGQPNEFYGTARFANHGIIWDADAQGFFHRVGGLSTMIRSNAVNELVKDLKANSIWQLCDIIYPFAGTSASQNAGNLKSSSFTIAFSGTLYHTNGIRSDGSTGYGNTGWIPSSHGVQFSTNSAHIAAYSLNASPADGTYLCGVYDSANGVSRMGFFRNTINAAFQGLNGNFFSFGYSASSDWNGMWIGSRISAIRQFAIVRNNFWDDSLVTATKRTTKPIYIAALNNDNSAAQSFWNGNVRYFSAGAGLSQARAEALRQIVERFVSNLDQ